MNKKLPKIFRNKIEKNIFNNASYSKGKSIDVEEKIAEIFSKKGYLYKVILTLKNGDVAKTIIAKNKDSLITIDNELIKIKDIYDIKIKKDY